MRESGLVVCLLCICSVFPSAFSSHFLGGSIMVRPQPGGTQSEVEITARISYKRSDWRYYCDSSTLVKNNSSFGPLTFVCQYGCRGSVAVYFLCIGYSAENDWSYMEGHETHVVNFTDINAITIGTTGGAWIYPYGRWNISTTFSLVPRADTGEINSSPRVASFPKLNLLEGHHYIISLAVIDPDGDEIRCRWANGTECSSVCNSIPGAVLDPNSCTIRYNADNGTGLKAVAIMIEDFLPSSFVPLSSVALQFLVEVANSSEFSCASPPRFITSLRRVCIPPSTVYTQQLIANSGCSNVSITSIQIIASNGASKGELQHIPGTNNYYTNVTWMPTANQQNDTHFICYMAVSSEGLTSEQSCIKLAAGYHPPAPLLESAIPNHQLVYPSNNTLQIMFDRQIQRPSTAAFIRFYNNKSGEEVYQINTSSSLEVNFNGTNLTIVPNYVFTEGSTYYVNVDGRAVESVEGCHLSNNTLLSKTFWTFEILNLVPVFTSSVSVIGQLKILQCSVTTIRDINSRVDFVWISNGVELKRVEGVTGESSTNNLVVYTNNYIIPQLSIADNNSLYTCEVIINRSPLISATGNFTVNITGTNLTDDVHDNNTNHLCTLPPQFVEPTLPQRACKVIPQGTPFMKQVMAISGCSNVTITSIQVSAPNGTSVGELQHVQGTNNYYINVTWMPTADQQNKTHFLCFVAINLAGLSSELFCMKLAVGYNAPAPIPESANHQLMYPLDNTLHIMFDRPIQRPSTSTFIRFYQLRVEVYQIDVSLSTEVTYIGSSLRVVPNYTFTEGIIYYMNFDRGVVQTVHPEECLLVNEPILSDTFWTLEFVNFKSVFTSSVSVTALGDQTVGQPLILQCSVTTIRDVNSRVDFVWISNGRELERMEGVSGKLTENNLAVYTDHYIISQLSTADDNNLYICKVLVNAVQIVSAAGNLTLNLNMGTEVTVMDNACNGDGGGFGFIIMFAVSAVINLLLVAAVTILICLLMWKKKAKPVDANHKAKNKLCTTASEIIYDLPSLTSKVEQDKESITNYGYSLIKQKETKSQKQDAKSDDTKIKMEENPAYRCSFSHTNL